jgi:hypothetical protein
MRKTFALMPSIHLYRLMFSQTQQRAVSLTIIQFRSLVLVALEQEPAESLPVVTNCPF